MDYSFIQGHRYLWRLPHTDTQRIADGAAHFNVSFAIIQTLFNRGFSSYDEMHDFLFGTSDTDVAHASRMKDADKAVDRIQRAILNREKILIFGDYDVDGITSSALMMISLLPLDAQVNFFLPHRVRDGYGLSTKAVARAAANGYTLIITVDNGITAFEPALKARELGVDLIITDHHRAHDHVPDAYAIVNPNQEDCAYPFKGFAGVGVTFKILSLLYERLGLLMPAKAYELLLLGTVADVVPLLKENRFWVRHCLGYVNKVESKSFQVLKKNGKVTRPVISATDIGFSIAPQINALGRLEDPRQGVKFLIGSDHQEVEEVGVILQELNQARRTIERSIFESIQQQVVNKTIDLERDTVIIATSNSWPPGVIGLVASRVVSAYGRPTLLFHVTADGIAKGSCRSIAEFNMFDALHANREHILQFGGHSQAAGLSLKVENIPKLKAGLEQLVATQLTEFDLKQKLVLDAQVQLSDLNQKFVTDMSYLEPFGNQNYAPTFLIQGVTLIQKPVLLKDLHVKCMIFADGIVKPVIFFNRPELFEILMHQQDAFSLAAHVVENHWNGRVNVELTGIDVAL
jgi:single-stranded-DNA-specific exonuclease